MAVIITLEWKRLVSWIVSNSERAITDTAYKVVERTFDVKLSKANWNAKQTHFSWSRKAKYNKKDVECVRREA